MSLVFIFCHILTLLPTTAKSPFPLGKSCRGVSNNTGPFRSREKPITSDIRQNDSPFLQSSNTKGGVCCKAPFHSWDLDLIYHKYMWVLLVYSGNQHLHVARVEKGISPAFPS